MDAKYVNVGILHKDKEIRAINVTIPVRLSLGSAYLTLSISDKKLNH